MLFNKNFSPVCTNFAVMCTDLQCFQWQHWMFIYFWGVLVVPSRFEQLEIMSNWCPIFVSKEMTSYIFSFKVFVCNVLLKKYHSSLIWVLGTDVSMSKFISSSQYTGIQFTAGSQRGCVGDMYCSHDTGSCTVCIWLYMSVCFFQESGGRKYILILKIWKQDLSTCRLPFSCILVVFKASNSLQRP